ncbi:hypothetical protein Tco_1168876 [Tanacetum coccineum]
MRNERKIIRNKSKRILRKLLKNREVINRSTASLRFCAISKGNPTRLMLQLYKALVDAYEADKILLDTYGDTVTIKRPRDGADDDQEPSVGTDRGSKRRRSGKEPASTSAPSETTTTTAGKTTSTGSKTHKKSASQSAPVEETMQTTDVFKHIGPTHHQEVLKQFLSVFGPTFVLMKGTCKSLTELEYFCEEVYKATTEKLDWINPEGRQYPYDLRKPLPLVPNSQGRHVIPFHHFINNDLEYLRGGESSRKYSTSVTKTKAADYGHIKWIEDLVPSSMWSQVIVSYDKFALLGISHWGKKQRQFYAFTTTRESARDVYSKRRIIAITKVEIVEWQTTSILTGSLRVEDLQLGVESYQKKLNLTKPDTYRSNLRRRDAYTPYFDPRGFIYENKDKKNRLMRIVELHKFSDGTLDDVRTALNDRLKGIRMEYLPQKFVGGRPYGGDLRLLQRTI